MTTLKEIDIEEEKDFMAVYEYLGFLDNLKGN